MGHEKHDAKLARFKGFRDAALSALIDVERTLAVTTYEQSRAQKDGREGDAEFMKTATQSLTSDRDRLRERVNMAEQDYHRALYKDARRRLRDERLDEVCDETFEVAWARVSALGFEYGDDALEQVRFGFDLAGGYVPNPFHEEHT